MNAFGHGDLEARLLGAAQAGDEHAFRRLIELHRGEVHAHCYRMLGSLQDAEDAYQDTLLRAWRSLERFDGRSRLVTWLYSIATNVCLAALQRTARTRTLPAVERSGGPQPDWVGPYPDELLDIPCGRADPSARYEQRESIELAFVCALQLLPGRQRATLLLSEVLGFSANEIAEALDTSVAAVNSALQRARARLDDARPSESQQALARRCAPADVKRIAERFAVALEDGDTHTLTRLLADDVVFEMPPHPGTVRGRSKVARSWLVPTHRPTYLRTVVTRMNGQPAVAVYRSPDPVSDAVPIAVDVLTTAPEGIVRVTAFRDPESFEALGLPLRVPARTDTNTRTTGGQS